MARLQDQLTPVTPPQLFGALSRAWQKAFNETPHRTSLLVLLAQWALETGRGHSMHCYNLGNVKSAQKSGDWCFFRCNEIINGKEVWFEPDHPACCFRAFASLDDGALDYLNTLHDRFKPAWPAVVAGDPQSFVHLLKINRYFTADEAQYTRSVVSLFNEFSRTLPLTVGSATSGAAMPDIYSPAGLSQTLTGLGFPADPNDSTSAVRAFQASQGLVTDGIAGRITLATLAKAWTEASASGKPG
jgi:hypothetical protein